MLAVLVSNSRKRGREGRREGRKEGGTGRVML